MGNLFFREEQKTKYAWIGLAISGLSAIVFGIGLYRQLVLGISFGTKPVNDIGLIIFSIFIPLLFLGLYFLINKSALYTEVRDDAIIIRYPIYVNKPIKFMLNDIDFFQKRYFRPVKELGGHGVKTKGRTKSYTVFGKIGLDILLKSGERIIIGTQKSEAFIAAIKKAKQRMR